MSKPNYRATVTFDPERKLFLARAPELEHCSAEGASRSEAMAKLEEEIDAQLANMLSHGATPPRALDEEVFSGEISAKVSRLLHRDLAYQARTEGVELDQLMSELLAAALESRRQHRGVRHGNARPRDEQGQSDSVGNRYEGGGRQRGFGRGPGASHLLDDRANFIEYVRGLEQNGGAHGRHAQGGRRRGRGGRPNHGPQQRGHGGPRNASNGSGGPSGRGPEADAAPDSDTNGNV